MTNWVKPTTETKFHIDFDWWEQQGRSFRVQLLSHLCTDCQTRYKDYREGEAVDWIDAETAEVTRVDGLWNALRTCCSLKPDYTSPSTPLMTAVFRTFLANGNHPLTPVELQVRLRRPADTILRTIGGAQVHHGIKAVRKREGGE